MSGTMIIRLRLIEGKDKEQSDSSLGGRLISTSSAKGKSVSLTGRQKHNGTLGGLLVETELCGDEKVVNL